MSDETTEIEMPPGAHRLPSGGWVLLSDPDAATGRDVFALRRALDSEGMGEMANVLLTSALEIRVIGWEIPGKPKLPLPRSNKTWLSQLGYRDVLALERLVKKWAKDVMQGDDEEAGEGPHEPASA